MQFAVPGGRRKPPYAFTEQGVYQLATVLKGELAERQSVAIMRVFKAMREYISQNRQFFPHNEILYLSSKQAKLEDQIKAIKDIMITKTDLSDIMKLFDQGISNEEILILDGKPFTSIDSKLLSTEMAGGFTGVTVGPYCRFGRADFDGFDLN